MKKKDQTGFRATGLFLSGFQSIAEPTYIPLKPLTMLYGPNSAGKSAVIDAIGFFEDIASQNKSQVMEKAGRWQHRGLDESGDWPEPGNAVMTNGRFDGFGCLRVGVEFVVPADWIDHLSREVKDHTSAFDEQPHLEKLKLLVGRTVSVDVGIWGPMNPSTIRMAVDHTPIFESRSGDFDDGQMVSWDSSYRRRGDDGFDEDTESDRVDGPLRIFPDHSFWSSDYRIGKLSEFASSNIEPAIGAFVNNKGGCLNLYDATGHGYSDWTDDSGCFGFGLGRSLFDAMYPPSEMPKKQRFTSTGKGIPEKVSRKRTWNIDYLEELVEELGVFCKAILQLGAASLRRVHVSGSRSILAPANMVLHEKRDQWHVDRHPTSYVTLARNLAYDETKSKKIYTSRVPNLQRLHYSRGYKPQADHRVVNQWLTATLPSLRGYKLRADAYLSEPLAKKRKPFGAMDEFAYRLYLVDAQGRPHDFEDVGSGFSYLFPILVALWDGTWSIIEQPELHLHPAAQCDVADVFIAAKNMGHAALIESHSENLILRILRRIRETTEGRVKERSLRVTPDDVAVLYFDPQSDGTTKVKQLRISRDGDFIDRWPAGFFEERSRELFGE
jgi:hypothetical protein